MTRRTEQLHPVRHHAHLAAELPPEMLDPGPEVGEAEVDSLPADWYDVKPRTETIVPVAESIPQS